MQRRRAFTIIEVLVVISIISVLAMLLLGVVGRARGEAKVTNCINNLRQLGTALNVYSGNFHLFTPESKLGGSKYQTTHKLWTDGRPIGLGILYKTGVIDNPEVLFCPAASAFTPDGPVGLLQWDSPKGSGGYVASSYLYRAESAGGSLDIDKMTRKAVVMDYNNLTGARHNLNHDESEPVMILFGDGHVDRVETDTDLLVHSPERSNLHAIWYDADKAR